MVHVVCWFSSFGVSCNGVIELDSTWQTDATTTLAGKCIVFVVGFMILMHESAVSSSLIKHFERVTVSVDFCKGSSSAMIF